MSELFLLVNHQLKKYATIRDVTTTMVQFSFTLSPTTATTDVLTEILREGARTLLVQAVETEVAEWIERHAHLKDDNVHQQVVRNGRLPPRKIATGLGLIEIRPQHVHDRRDGHGAETITSRLFPPYLRKTKSVEDADPLGVPYGNQHGGLLRGIAIAAGPRCAGAVGIDDHTAEEYLGSQLP